MARVKTTTALTSANADSTRSNRDSTGATTPEDALDARRQFEIDCLKSARYHEDRERFFAKVHRVSMFFVVASGTAAIGQLVDVRLVPYWAAIAALSGLVDLVFDVSGRARLHSSLRGRFYDLIAQVEDSSRPLKQLRADATLLYADEPPCMHAVNAVAYNGAMLAFDRPKEHLFMLKWYHRCFRNVWSFATSPIKTVAEIQREKEQARLPASR